MAEKFRTTSPYCAECHREIDNSVPYVLRQPGPAQAKFNGLQRWKFNSIVLNANTLLDEVSPINSSIYKQECVPLDVSSTKQELYHAECLNCYYCGENLSKFPNSRCWKYQNNHVVCPDCRKRLTHCARCHTRINYGTWVHSLSHLKFHLTCLICEQCGVQLRPGDQCGMHNQRLFCEEHFLQMKKFKLSKMEVRLTDQGHPLDMFTSMPGELLNSMMYNQSSAFSLELLKMRASGDTAALSKGTVRSDQDSNELVSKLNDRRKLEKDSPCATDSHPLNAPSMDLICSKNKTGTNETWLNLDEVSQPDERLAESQEGVATQNVEAGQHSVDSSASSGGSTHSKSKRIRTSFTTDQLATLQANFDIEANPDGQELEKIASLARLNKRVTQVWFQNARARKKKIECRQLNESPRSALGLSLYYSTEMTRSLEPHDENFPGESDCKGESEQCRSSRIASLSQTSLLKANLFSKDLPCGINPQMLDQNGLISTENNLATKSTLCSAENIAPQDGLIQSHYHIDWFPLTVCLSHQNLPLEPGIPGKHTQPTAAQNLAPTEFSKYDCSSSYPMSHPHSTLSILHTNQTAYDPAVHIASQQSIDTNLLQTTISTMIGTPNQTIKFE